MRHFVAILGDYGGVVAWMVGKLEDATTAEVTRIDSLMIHATFSPSIACHRNWTIGGHYLNFCKTITFFVGEYSLALSSKILSIM